jgi:hypothetical protein
VRLVFHKLVSPSIFCFLRSPPLFLFHFNYLRRWFLLCQHRQRLMRS